MCEEQSNVGMLPDLSVAKISWKRRKVGVGKREEKGGEKRGRGREREERGRGREREREGGKKVEKREGGGGKPGGEG